MVYLITHSIRELIRLRQFPLDLFVFEELEINKIEAKKPA